MNFEDVKRRFEKRQTLRRQGKVRVEDAFYELQREFEVSPTDLEEELRKVADATVPNLPGEIEVSTTEPDVGLAIILRLEEITSQVRRYLFPRPAFAYACVGAAAAQAVGAPLPLGLIPALFVTSDGSGSTPGNVEVLQKPRLRPDGRLVIGIRIPKASCPGATAEMAVLVAPTEKPIAEPLTMKAGIPQRLSVAVPPQLQAGLQDALQGAADDITKLDWAKLPLRFIVRSATPPRRELSAASQGDDKSVLWQAFKRIGARAAERFGAPLKVWYSRAVLATSARSSPFFLATFRRPTAAPPALCRCTRGRF